MNYQWHFRPRHRGDDISDPISGEFFADSGSKNPSTGLVREALQNAIDAGRRIDRWGDPVVVKIGIYRGEYAISGEAAAERFASLRPHLSVNGNGLRNAPTDKERCEYLTVEDFGTSGLTGDTTADSVDGIQNNFVDFVRSDGRTRKNEGDRGSWGVGKNVFPRASRINGYIAYTVRHDDGRKLVIGKSILKIRRVGADEFQPQCYMAESWESGDVPRPYEGPEAIKLLCRDFRLKRETEPGLSLVIPWLDDDVSYEDLLAAVVDQYYYAILSGDLAVELTDGDSVCTLSRSTVSDVVNSRLPDHAAIIHLAAWSMKVRESERLTLNALPPDAAQKWDSELVPEDVRTDIAQRLLRRERVAVRIPVHVHARNAAAPERSYFDLYLEHHDENNQIRPSFVREQLLINDVKRSVRVPKIRPLVVIDDKPLAALLRAAEPPSHADWSASTGNFKNAYHNGNHVITFVKTAVSQLMRIVRAGDEEPDPTITIDFFALPERDERPTTPGGRKKKEKSGDDSDQEIEPPPRKPRRFTIAEVAGGFVIRPGEPETTPPSRLRVAMAYDVLSGSPWKQYESADFDLTKPDRSGIQIAASGAVDFKVKDSNKIHLSLTGPEFELFVTGFDRNRDLIVRAYDPKEPPDADSAAELHEAEEAHA